MWSEGSCSYSCSFGSKCTLIYTIRQQFFSWEMGGTWRRRCKVQARETILQQGKPSSPHQLRLGVGWGWLPLADELCYSILDFWRWLHVHCPLIPKWFGKRVFRKRCGFKFRMMPCAYFHNWLGETLLNSSTYFPNPQILTCNKHTSAKQGALCAHLGNSCFVMGWGEASENWVVSSSVRGGREEKWFYKQNLLKRKPEGMLVWFRHNTK